jgi:phosphoenolpyruvate carboxykinase (ATP)
MCAGISKVVLVVVEDTGPRTPEGPLAEVFHRFYSERPANDFGNSSELVLAISKQIIDAHDAAIWAEIFATTSKFGTVIENMVFDHDTLELDFDDDSLTANMRCAYPLGYISNASDTALGGHPKNVIMLTCDAFGVLPPIARLTPAQAMYHFLSGFTSKVAGTERGVTEPEPTFSTCFGAPFMPRRPEAYGNLLREKIAKHGATCWLVNTGWTGGAYGTGSRMPIKATRALLTAALDGSLAEAKFRKDENFGFDVPVEVPGVDKALLDPRRTWNDPAAYDAQAAKLVQMFADNFEQYVPYIDEDVKAAAIS